MNKINKNESSDDFSLNEIEEEIKVVKKTDIKSKFYDIFIRNVTGFSLFFLLILITFLGPFYLCLLILSLQICIFWELINIKNFLIPKSRYRTNLILCWGIYFTGILFIFFHSFKGKEILIRNSLLKFFVDRCRAIFAPIYIILVILYTFKFKEDLIKPQIWLFILTHISILIASSFSLSFAVIYKGIVWWVMSLIQVGMNDAGALYFGRIFGKRTLFKLSPKKTQEGFIGAIFTTILCTFIFNNLIKISYLSFWKCEQTQLTFIPFAYATCPTPKMFTPDFKIEFWGLNFLNSLELSEYEFHSYICALFASFIAPFGGYFSSAIKRSFKIKDYSNLLPGHGGICDRFDCQLIMNVFIYCYTFGQIYKKNSSYVIAELLIRNLSNKEKLSLFELKNRMFD